MSNFYLSIQAPSV